MTMASIAMKTPVKKILIEWYGPLSDLANSLPRKIAVNRATMNEDTAGISRLMPSGSRLYLVKIRNKTANIAKKTLAANSGLIRSFLTGVVCIVVTGNFDSGCILQARINDWQPK